MKKGGYGYIRHKGNQKNCKSIKMREINGIASVKESVDERKLGVA